MTKLNFQVDRQPGHPKIVSALGVAEGKARHRSRKITVRLVIFVCLIIPAGLLVACVGQTKINNPSPAASSQKSTLPSTVDPRPSQAQLAGTWQVIAVNTGKPELDRDLMTNDHLRYHFEANGSGWMDNRSGRHSFAWKTANAPDSKATSLRLEYQLEYLEPFERIETSNQGRTLILRGHFDIDLDNWPEDIMITLRRLP